MLPTKAVLHSLQSCLVATLIAHFSSGRYASQNCWEHRRPGKRCKFAEVDPRVATRPTMPLPSTFELFRRPLALGAAGSPRRKLSRTGMMLFWFQFSGEMAKNQRTGLHNLFRRGCVLMQDRQGQRKKPTLALVTTSKWNTTANHRGGGHRRAVLHNLQA